MKSISYAYASSDYAKEAGFYKNGCWVVTFPSASKRKKKLEVKGFASYAEAFTFAETLPDEYSSFSVNAYHAKHGFEHAPEELREFHLKENIL